MIIITTPGELLELGLWDDYCEISGTSVWAVNEGMINREEEIYIDSTYGWLRDRLAKESIFYEEDK